MGRTVPCCASNKGGSFLSLMVDKAGPTVLCCASKEGGSSLKSLYSSFILTERRMRAL